MSRYTKDDRHMSAARSASTRSRATEIDRIRARRRAKRRRRSVLPTLLALVVLLALLLGVIWIARRPQPQVRQESYPIRYAQEVQAAAEEFSLEPAYLYAIILAESSFRPEAVSSVGALGLMQIMPETGKWLAGKFDMKDTFTVEMLTDPAINVRFGSWYLNFLLNRYDGDMRCATAAYHAGQGTVDKWLKDPAYSEDGKTLAVIAYNTTDNYVNKVMKYYEKYLLLLAEDD